MTPPHRRADRLDVPHGFFGRDGGVSQGVYRGLNGGPGSGDDPEAVAVNRARVAEALGTAHLVTAYQTHSAVAAYIDRVPDETIKADALVTDKPNLAIGVLAADCVPVLFSSANGLVGAAHAGWRGSLGGILEATLDLMAARGAARDAITAAIGPCLRAPAFEVGDDLIAEVTGKYPEAARFFTPGDRPGKSIYDHVAFVAWRLTEAGIDARRIEDVGGCTLTHPERWFSYRESRAKNASDYGRNLSAITAAQG